MTEDPPGPPSEPSHADAGAEILLELPDELRPELKEPFGPIHEDPRALLASAGDPLIAVGDIVTHHLVRAGRPPDLAFVDGRTERAAVDESVRRTVEGDGETWFDRRVEVANPSATLTASLLGALGEAIQEPDRTTLVVVYGEEDLATIPAVVAAPDGASVVYGQPGEGMVHVLVRADTRERIGSLLDRLFGDVDRARRLLGTD